ncbi:MAG: DUF6473 family protein [Sphingobium sp.]
MAGMLLDRRALLASIGAAAFAGTGDLAQAAAAPKTAMRRWYPDYQARDIDIVDYQEFRVRGCDARFRGPGFDPFAAKRGSFFTCLGAAQTYGCFSGRPFPARLADRIGVRALNLGIGGAGPGFYLINPSLIDAANRGRFVILQAMAARHEANSRYAADGYVEYVRDRVRGDSVDSGTAWARLIAEDFDNLPKYVAETRQTWLETMRELVSAIKVPILFFWFSTRAPDYTIDWDGLRAAKAQGAPVPKLVNALFAHVPQMVDGPTARAAAALCQVEASCRSTRGSGGVLVNRHTGLPIDPKAYRDRGIEYQPLLSGRNHYYPSDEMHEDAAAILEPLARGLST